jgi:hypothetical protein
MDIYPKEMQLVCLRDICTPVFIEPLLIMAKIWKQPKCLWMNKIWQTYITIYYLVIKEGHLAICSNMDENVGCYAM